jgi:hypothetical protein
VKSPTSLCRYNNNTNTGLSQVVEFGRELDVEIWKLFEAYLAQALRCQALPHVHRTAVSRRNAGPTSLKAMDEMSREVLMAIDSLAGHASDRLSVLR